MKIIIKEHDKIETIVEENKLPIDKEMFRGSHMCRIEKNNEQIHIKIYERMSEYNWRILIEFDLGEEEQRYSAYYQDKYIGRFSFRKVD